MTHWPYFHGHSFHFHPAGWLIDAAVFGGGTLAAVFGMLATADPVEFSGLNSLIVSMTGLAGVIIGGVMKWQSNRIEMIKITATSNTGRVEQLETEAAKLKQQVEDANRRADEAKKRAEEMHLQLEKSRENFHRTTNEVAVLSAERELRIRGTTPDPDRSGPQKVIVMNDEGHPVPTEPVKKEAPK